MSRRDLGTSIRRRGKTVDKSAMEQMLRRERAMRKRRRKQKSISLAAAVSKNVIALAACTGMPEWIGYILSAVVGVAIIVIFFKLLSGSKKDKIDFSKGQSV